MELCWASAGWVKSAAPPGFGDVGLASGERGDFFRRSHLTFDKETFTEADESFGYTGWPKVTVVLMSLCPWATDTCHHA